MTCYCRSKINCSRILVTGILCAIFAVCSFSDSAAAESVIVALENFEDDLGAMSPGNGTARPGLQGLPSGQGNDGSSTRVIEGTDCCVGQLQPGRWVTNGYNNASPVNLDPNNEPDTNPNLGTSGIALSGNFGPAKLLPNGDTTGFQGFYQSRGSGAGGIKMARTSTAFFSLPQPMEARSPRKRATVSSASFKSFCKTQGFRLP